jgi:hypothetical protein
MIFYLIVFHLEFEPFPRSPLARLQYPPIFW